MGLEPTLPFTGKQIFKCFSALRLSLYHIISDLGSRYIVCTHLSIFLLNLARDYCHFYMADTFPELAYFYSKNFFLGTHYLFISEIFSLTIIIRTKICKFSILLLIELPFQKYYKFFTSIFKLNL